MRTVTVCPVCRGPMDSDLICCDNCSVADALFVPRTAADELLAIMERTKHGVWHDPTRGPRGKWVSVAGCNFDTAADAIAAIPARLTALGIKA